MTLHQNKDFSTSELSEPIGLMFFFSNFSGFIIDRTAEECDRKQGKSGGVTHSKGTQAGSRTRVQSLGIWVTRATNRIKRCPWFDGLFSHSIVTADYLDRQMDIIYKERLVSSLHIDTRWLNRVLNLIMRPKLHNTR